MKARAWRAGRDRIANSNRMWMVSGADWSRWDTRRGPCLTSWRWSVGSVAGWPSMAGRWIGSTRPTSTRSSPISTEMAVVMACFGRDWCCCEHTWSMSVQCRRITRRRGMWWVSWSIPIVNGCNDRAPLSGHRPTLPFSARRWRRSERPDRGRGQRVPAGTGWHDSGVPPRLSTDTIRSLLDSCDPVDPGRDPELLAIAADRLEPVIGAAVSR
jgi:hypothetical protein